MLMFLRLGPWVITWLSTEGDDRERRLPMGPARVGLGVRVRSRPCSRWPAARPWPHGLLVRSARAHRPYEPGIPLVHVWRAVPPQAQCAAGQPVVPVADERVGNREADARSSPGSPKIERKPSVRGAIHLRASEAGFVGWV
jgi:hypothetical protein